MKKRVKKLSKNFVSTSKKLSDFGIKSRNDEIKSKIIIKKKNKIYSARAKNKKLQILFRRKKWMFFSRSYTSRS